MRSRSAIEFSDVVAATFIVGKDLIEADFLTVPEANLNLPAGGGSIFVLQGTYTLTASIAFPNKSVKIIGTGDSTIFVAPTTLPAFSIPFGSLGRYEFDGFQVTGDNSVGQSLISIDDVVDVKFANLNTTGLKDIVATTMTPEVKFLNSCFMMTSLAATSSFWRGTAIGGGGSLAWEYVEATITTPSTDGIVGKPEWDVTASYIGGGGPLTTTFNLGKVRIQGFKTDKCKLELTEPGNEIVNLESIDGNVSILNNRTAIANSIFTTPTLSGTQVSITGAGGAGGPGDWTISGCIFDGSGLIGTNTQIDVLDVQGVEIVGCSFSNNGTGAATDTNINVGSTGGICKLTVVGCQFFSGVPAQALTESALATITGKYSDNLNFETAVVTSNLSTVNGNRRVGVTAGVTTIAFVNQFTFTNQRSVPSYGTVKNTGGVNSLEVRETGIDAFGVTTSVTTVVAPGGVFVSVAPFLGLAGTSFPPFVSYAVDVRHPVAATTFDLQFTGLGVA